MPEYYQAEGCTPIFPVHHNPPLLHLCQPHYSNPMFYGPPGYDITLNTGNTSMVPPFPASLMNHGYPGYNIAANTGSAPPVPLPTASLGHLVPANQSLGMSLAAARRAITRPRPYSVPILPPTSTNIAPELLTQHILPPASTNVAPELLNQPFTFQ